MSNPAKSNGNAPRLAFYKQPQQKTNTYQFEEKDLVRSSVVQQRFKQQQSISTSSSSSTSINQVSEGGQANQAGLKLGDTVTKINQVETKNMSLTKATKSIQLSDNELKLSVKRLDNYEIIHANRHSSEAFSCSFRLILYSFEEDEKSSVQEREVVLKASASKSTGSEKKVENRG